MKTTNDYISIIKSHISDLTLRFNISSLYIYGSVARGEQTENSDIDIYVKMPAKMYLVIAAKQYLEEILGCNVDVVRDHPSLNSYLRQQIEHDGINVFGAA